MILARCAVSFHPPQWSALKLNGIPPQGSGLNRLTSHELLACWFVDVDGVRRFQTSNAAQCTRVRRFPCLARSMGKFRSTDCYLIRPWRGAGRQSQQHVVPGAEAGSRDRFVIPIGQPDRCFILFATAMFLGFLRCTVVDGQGCCKAACTMMNMWPTAIAGGIRFMILKTVHGQRRGYPKFNQPAYLRFVFSFRKRARTVDQLPPSRTMFTAAERMRRCRDALCWIW